ncbi:MAG: hypothetical protein EPO02_10395 [Nitrospirae bacterium]|nr:MAG: hypothetical protein EPO02_10395 [Nitrospirota bacterium]
MNTKISDILSRIAELERELERELELDIDNLRSKFQYRIEKGRIAFERETCALHKKMRQGIVAFLWEAPLASLLVAPVIYSLAVPFVLLDCWLWLYQAVCFPVYGIAKVDRSRYILLDRSHLRYLNGIERLNCDYCGYANGLIAYVREIASRTEQYFCPIKHARRWSGPHSRYREFLDFGDAAAYKKELVQLRADLK